MNINQEIAIKGAELLWPEPEHVIYADNSVVAVSVLHGTDGELNTIFDPANNANDMNKLIEALNIYCDPAHDKWYCGQITYGGVGDNINTTEDKSRDEAIRQCVIKALGLHKDSEALGADND